MNAPRRRPAAVVGLALAAFAVFGLVGALAAAAGGKTYRSTAVLTIDQPALLATSRDAGPIQKLVVLRAQYAAVLRTTAVAEPIAQRVGLSRSTVAQRVAAKAARNSLLIVVTGDGPNSGKARQLTTAAANELVDYAARTQHRSGVPDKHQVVLSVASPARQAVVVRGGPRAVLTAGAFLGLAAAAAAVAAMTVRRERG